MTSFTEPITADPGRISANTMTYVGNDGERLGVLLLKIGHIALVGQCGYGLDTSTSPPSNALVMKFVFEAVGGPVEWVVPTHTVLPPDGVWSGNQAAYIQGSDFTYLSPGATGDGTYGNPTDRSAEVVIVHGPSENAVMSGVIAVMDAKGPTFSGTGAASGDYNNQSCLFTAQVAG
jgi:hypothetical protein